MLKRRHFGVDTSSPCREVQVSTPASGRQNGVFPALGRRNKASPAAPIASTLQNPLGTRSVDAEVSTSPSQAVRQTLPADKRLRRSHIWGRERSVAPPTVVGNPPFNAVEAFARHALELGARKVALLFPVARLNAARWLKELPLRRIWLLTPRPSMPPGYVIARGEKPGGGKTDFAWLIFERGYTSKAEIRWLRRDGDI